MSSSELATGLEPIRPDLHLCDNNPSRDMMPDRDPSRLPSDVLILDGSTRQALVATRTLGRLGLRIMAAESADLCDSRFGVPTFASRWSARDHILPSYHDDPTAYAEGLARSRPRTSHSRADPVDGRVGRRSPSLALLLRARGCCARAGFGSGVRRGERQTTYPGGRRRARDSVSSNHSDRPNRGHRSRPRRGRAPCRHQADPFMGLQHGSRDPSDLASRAERVGSARLRGATP